MEKVLHIVHQDYQIERKDRELNLKQSSKIIWLTGLSGSGKSTIANALEVELNRKGYHTYLLDGDNVRSGLNSDLDFSESGRNENIRRIGEVAKLFLDSGTIVLSAFVSPFRKDRDSIRSKVADGDFVEIHVDCPLEICEQRDVKGLYAKARKGIIKDFTGISSPFEEPLNPEIIVHTDKETVEESLDKILNLLEEKIK